MMIDEDLNVKSVLFFKRRRQREIVAPLDLRSYYGDERFIKPLSFNYTAT
jgi:hypothetical protein